MRIMATCKTLLLLAAVAALALNSPEVKGSAMVETGVCAVAHGIPEEECESLISLDNGTGGTNQTAPAVISVTSTADVIASDGFCTLREALINANSDGDTTGGDCGAGSEADTIAVPSGTYTLTLGAELAIDGDLILNGESAADTIIQADIGPDMADFRVFNVIAGEVFISGVSIRNGVALDGGGIFNSGTTTIANSEVLENSTTYFGAGIFNEAGGILNVRESSITFNSAINDNFTGFGGGIYNQGAATLIDSTIAGNSVDKHGAGVLNRGDLTVVNTTISNNHSASFGFGSGIYNSGEGASLILLNSTISGNSGADEGGGIFNTGGAAVSVSNSTITGNETGTGVGAGFSNWDGSFRYKGSIIAGNRDGDGNKGADCFGSSSNTVSLGFNLLDPEAAPEIDPEADPCPTIATDLTPGGNPIRNVLERSLGSNSGLTRTHALVEGSMAIDAIPVADCSDADGNPVTADQRGVIRPQGAACDIGAFEFDQSLAAEATGSFDLHQDILDGATGLKVAITQATSPETGSSVAVPLEGFQVQLTYDGSCVNILALRGLDFQITAETIDDPGGLTEFAGTDLEGQLAPVDLGLALTRLAGSNQTPCDVELNFTALTEMGGEPVSLESAGLNRELLRGDARADGDINIADAGFIAQYLLGSMGACTTEATTSCLHSVNAASVLQDGAFDKKTIADALFLAQYSMGQRDEFYNLVPDSDP